MGFKSKEARLAYQREYQKKWLAKRKQEWIDSRGGKCEACGSVERLEVDHIDKSTKSIDVNRLWSATAERRNAELVKCQVLCFSCHRAKSARELDHKSQHGTHSKYSMGCRCDECRIAHNTSTTQWKRGRAVMQQPAKL